MQTKQTAAIVLLCNEQGIIRALLYQQLPNGHRFREGQPFPTSMAPGSIGKADNFFAILQTQGTALGWKMHVAVGEGLLGLHFVGITNGRDSLILGADTHAEILRLAKELNPINTELFTGLSTTLAEWTTEQKPTQIATDDHLYEELSQVNNELLTTQRALAKANAILAKLNEEKNHFLGMAAHDMRGPLGVIQMYSDFLIDDNAGKLEQEQLEFLSIIRSTSTFILQLVDDLLDLTKIEAGRLDLDLQPTDLCGLIAHNVKLNQLLATHKSITLSFEHELQIPYILVDAAKIQQVLNNLISNAIKFSNPHSTVYIHLQKNEDAVTLSVRDQGQGIPAAELDRLFIPFQKTSVRSTGGEPSTGLGLAIVRRIIMGHQGTIFVNSVVDQGSTFVISLPISNSLEETAHE